MPILFYGLAKLAATGGTTVSSLSSWLECSQEKASEDDLLISTQRHVCMSKSTYISILIGRKRRDNRSFAPIILRY